MASVYIMWRQLQLMMTSSELDKNKRRIDDVLSRVKFTKIKNTPLSNFLTQKLAIVMIHNDHDEGSIEGIFDSVLLLHKDPFNESAETQIENITDYFTTDADVLRIKYWVSKLRQTDYSWNQKMFDVVLPPVLRHVVPPVCAYLANMIFNNSSFLENAQSIVDFIYSICMLALSCNTKRLHIVNLSYSLMPALEEGDGFDAVDAFMGALCVMLMHFLLLFFTTKASDFLHIKYPEMPKHVSWCKFVYYAILAGGFTKPVIMNLKENPTTCSIVRADFVTKSLGLLWEQAQIDSWCPPSERGGGEKEGHKKSEGGGKEGVFIFPTKYPENINYDDVFLHKQYFHEHDLLALKSELSAQGELLSNEKKINLEKNDEWRIKSTDDRRDTRDRVLEMFKHGVWDFDNKDHKGITWEVLRNQKSLQTNEDTYAYIPPSLNTGNERDKMIAHLCRKAISQNSVDNNSILYACEEHLPAIVAKYAKETDPLKRLNYITLQSAKWALYEEYKKIPRAWFEDQSKHWDTLSKEEKEKLKTEVVENLKSGLFDYDYKVGDYVFNAGFILDKTWQDEDKFYWRLPFNVILTTDEFSRLEIIHSKFLHSRGDYYDNPSWVVLVNFLSKLQKHYGEKLFVRPNDKTS